MAVRSVADPDARRIVDPPPRPGGAPGGAQCGERDLPRPLEAEVLGPPPRRPPVLRTPCPITRAPVLLLHRAAPRAGAPATAPEIAGSVRTAGRFRVSSGSGPSPSSQSSRSSRPRIGAGGPPCPPPSLDRSPPRRRRLVVRRRGTRRSIVSKITEPRV